MGLDMYLTGEKYNTYDAPETIEDGFKVKSRRLEIGYWRKHPNLHGYIVKHFASGIDDCQEIELSQADIDQIIEAINDAELPETEGFFFGQSDGSETKEDLEIFNKAKEWLLVHEKGVWRSVYYRASW